MTQTAAVEIKVWQVTDIEWFAAATPEQALVAYKEYATGCLGNDADEVMRDQLQDFGEPCECDIDKLQFQDDDGTSRTFREQLAKMIAGGEEFPAFFATSEY